MIGGVINYGLYFTGNYWMVVDDTSYPGFKDGYNFLESASYVKIVAPKDYMDKELGIDPNCDHYIKIRLRVSSYKKMIKILKWSKTID